MTTKKTTQNKNVRTNSTAPPSIKVKNRNTVRTNSTAPGHEKKSSKATIKKEIKGWSPPNVKDRRYQPGKEKPGFTLRVSPVPYAFYQKAQQLFAML